METEAKALYHLAGAEFKVFTEEIIGVGTPNPPFLDELDDDISNPDYRRVVIAFARGHGKSTHLSVMYPLWEIANNHNLRILLISATGTVSQMFLSEIVGHIGRNEKYREFSKAMDKNGVGVIPRLKPGKKMTEDWSGASITVEREGLNLKDPTINAVGLFGAILAKRADIIIVDDVVNQENSFTPEQRQKVKDWITNTVMPVLVPGGKFVYLGNTWSMDDVVAKFLGDPLFDVRKKRPAIVSEPTHPELWQEWARIRLDLFEESKMKQDKANAFYALHKAEMDEGIELAWPDRFFYGDLYLLRLQDPYAFARMYQCDPSDRPNQKFREAWLQEALRKGRGLRLQDKPHFEYIDLTTVGLDLAISQEQTADDTAEGVLDLIRYNINADIKQGDFLIRQIKRGKFTPKETRDMVTQDYYTIKPDGIRVESVAYQESMVRDLEDKSIPVRGHRTGSEKWDSAVGVNSLAILLEQGKLIIPNDESDPRTQELVSKLLSEMRAFPEDHTGDSLMALWFAFLEMQELLGTRFTFPKSSYGLKDPVRTVEARVEGEKKADAQIISEVEAIRRARADYWKEETKKLLH